MPPVLSKPICPFAIPLTPPAPLIVLLDLTDFNSPSTVSLLSLKNLTGKVQSTQDVHTTNRYHPYVSAQGHSQVVSSSIVNHAYSSPLSSAPLSPRNGLSHSPSPVPVASGSQTGRQVLTRRISIERPVNASWKNMETLLNWEPSIFKAFKVCSMVNCTDVA